MYTNKIDPSWSPSKLIPKETGRFSVTPQLHLVRLCGYRADGFREATTPPPPHLHSHLVHDD